MAHRAHHLQPQASSLVLPLSAPAVRSRLNTAFQFPIRSNLYGYTKDTNPPATTPCSKGSQSQRVSGMKVGDSVKSGKFRSKAEWFIMRILRFS